MKHLAAIATSPFTRPAISPVLRKGVGKPLLHICYAFSKLSINASRKKRGQAKRSQEPCQPGDGYLTFFFRAAFRAFRSFFSFCFCCCLFLSNVGITSARLQ